MVEGNFDQGMATNHGGAGPDGYGRRTLEEGTAEAEGLIGTDGDDLGQRSGAGSTGCAPQEGGLEGTMGEEMVESVR